MVVFKINLKKAMKEGELQSSNSTGSSLIYPMTRRGGAVLDVVDAPITWVVSVR